MPEARGDNACLALKLARASDLSHNLREGTDLDRDGSRLGCGHLPHPRGSPSVEPSGTCAGHLAAVLGLRKASLLQAALQEAVVVGSPGPDLCPFGGALAVQAHVQAPGAREVVWGRQARASSPWALLVFQALGAQGAVPLGTQLIGGELGGGVGTNVVGLGQGEQGAN